MALLCVGCDPPENTSTPASRAAPAERTRPFTFNSSDATYCIRFSPDGKTLASASKVVSLWDVQTRQESARLTGHRYPAVSLAFTPDGNFLASVCDDYHTKKGEILVWDVRTKSVSRTLESQDVYFSFVCFSPDGKTLASAGPRNSITLWDVETWTPMRTLEPHNNPVHCVEFSPDGNQARLGRL